MKLSDAQTQNFSARYAHLSPRFADNPAREMTDAVIIATARTPIGKAYRGRLNNTEAPTLFGHAIAAAISRAEIDPAQVEDVIMGCPMQQGTTGSNVARMSALCAGIPVSAGGSTIDRQCASGLQAIAVAARSVVCDGVEVAVAGGGESISLVQNNNINRFRAIDPALFQLKGDIYMPMLDTAEIVAKRHGISRERQDEYSLESQRRTGAARQSGRFDDELAPISVTMTIVDTATNGVSYRKTRLADDEGPRLNTDAGSLAALKPVRQGGTITAGNASQLSDGASAVVVMSDKQAAKDGVRPLGIFRAKLNVNGGAISVGHPYGMTGARLAGHALIEGRRRKAKIRGGHNVRRWRNGCGRSVRDR